MLSCAARLAAVSRVRPPRKLQDRRRWCHQRRSYSLARDEAPPVKSKQQASKATCGDRNKKMGGETSLRVFVWLAHLSEERLCRVLASLDTR
mgnify:CR=1 FL=1